MICNEFQHPTVWGAVFGEGAILKRYELLDPPPAFANVFDAIGEHIEQFLSGEFVSDLEAGEAKIDLPYAGAVALIADVNPEEFVFQFELLEPFILPLRCFGEAFHLGIFQTKFLIWERTSSAVPPC